MNIIKAGYEIIPRDGARGNIAVIELAARTCYKTESAIRDGSADTIVKMLIERQHTAMLEHGDYMFKIDDPKITNAIAETLQALEQDTGHHIHLSITRKGGRDIISGNVRAWRELIEADTLAMYYFTDKIDPVYFEGLVSDAANYADIRVHQIGPDELRTGFEKRVHLRQTVRFTVDRGVTHEFVRHRVMSFAQESSRYCDYTMGRFGCEITVIEPCYLQPETEAYGVWKRQCLSAETAYAAMKGAGCKPEEARAVLPTSTKADLIMTGTLGQWASFFDLRARQVTGKAHVQAAEVAYPLMLEMMRKYPDVFEN